MYLQKSKQPPFNYFRDAEVAGSNPVASILGRGAGIL